MGGSYRKERRDGWRDFLFFWRGLQGDERQWRVATRVVAEYELGGEARRAMYDEVVKLWRGNPRLRGALLYLLVVTKTNDSLVPWAEWGRVVGAPISAKELEGFLDMGPRAMAALPTIWAALGKGYSRGEIIVARLDKFIEDPCAAHSSFQGPSSTIRELVSKMIDEGVKADRVKLHAFLKQRIAEHPSERNEFQIVYEMSER